MPGQIASLGRRLTCLLYESLVVFSILLIGFLIPQSVFFAFGLQLGGKILMLHIWLLLMFYFVWSWLNGSQTLPMKDMEARPEHGRRQQPAPDPGPAPLSGGLAQHWLLRDRHHLGRVRQGSPVPARPHRRHPHHLDKQLISAAPPTKASRLPPAGTRLTAPWRWQTAARS